MKESENQECEIQQRGAKGQKKKSKKLNDDLDFSFPSLNKYIIKKELKFKKKQKQTIRNKEILYERTSHRFEILYSCAVNERLVAMHSVSAKAKDLREFFRRLGNNAVAQAD